MCPSLVRAPSSYGGAVYRYSIATRALVRENPSFPASSSPTEAQPIHLTISPWIRQFELVRNRCYTLSSICHSLSCCFVCTYSTVQLCTPVFLAPHNSMRAHVCGSIRNAVPRTYNVSDIQHADPESLNEQQQKQQRNGVCSDAAISPPFARPCSRERRGGLASGRTGRDHIADHRSIRRRGLRQLPFGR